MRSITAHALTYIGSDPTGGLTEKELSLTKQRGLLCVDLFLHCRRGKLNLFSFTTVVLLVSVVSVKMSLT